MSIRPLGVLMGTCALILTASAPTLTDIAVYPGQGLFAPRSGGDSALMCTSAFVVERNDTSERGILTAGHCLLAGARNVMLGGSQHVLGIESNLLDLSVSQEPSTLDEWERDGAMVTLPPLTPYTARVGGMWEVGNAITAQELRGLTGTSVCKLGVITGLTCGEVIKVTDEFVTVINMSSNEGHRIAYRGDSGAPMFIFDGRDRVRPVAMVSHGLRTDEDDLDPRIVTGQLVAPLLDRWDISLVPS